MATAELVAPVTSTGEILDVCESIMNADFVSLMEGLSFLGFEPEIIRRITSKKAWAKHVVTILTFYTTRGTLIQKAARRVKNKDIMAMVENSCHSLGVATTGRGKDRDDMTVSRLANAFPEITALCYEKVASIGKNRWTNLVPTLPPCLTFPGGAPKLLPYATKRWLVSERIGGLTWCLLCHLA